MVETKNKLQQIRDKERLIFINQEMSNIRSKIAALNSELHFLQTEQFDIQYRLRQGENYEEFYSKC